MQDPDFISLFVAPLKSAGINYMITGSVASSIYGEPRNTLDIAGMIEQQEPDREFLDTSIQSLGLQPQWQAANQLCSNH
jgi:hypothetical protein